MLDQAGHLLVSFAFEPQHWFMVCSLVGLSFLSFRKRLWLYPKERMRENLAFNLLVFFFLACHIPACPVLSGILFPPHVCVYTG